MYRLDRTAFTKQSFKESDNQRQYWLSKSPAERLSAAVYLQSVVFNFDPENPPRMDKSIVEKRQRP